MSRLAIAGLLLAVLSSACGSCYAAVAAHLSTSTQNSSGGCHPGNQPEAPEGDCGCPAWLASAHFDLDVSASPVRAGLDEAATIDATMPPMARRVQLAGDIRPGGLPGVPRLSPIRSFCTRLE
ncbi:MAG TPA: hypothetical protein VIC61_07610 [Gammaproteobacteria bacterium]